MDSGTHFFCSIKRDLKKNSRQQKKVTPLTSRAMAGGVARPVFPFFCDVWAGKVNDEKIGQGIWPDFEKQAFSEVFTKIGQFIVRGRKFELRLAIADQIIAKIETQKKSDARLQAVERIAEDLADELPDTAVDENGQKRPYGIRERTLKGWRKVRPAWREALKKMPNLTAEDSDKAKKPDAGAPAREVWQRSTFCTVLQKNLKSGITMIKRMLWKHGLIMLPLNHSITQSLNHSYHSITQITQSLNHSYHSITQITQITQSLKSLISLNHSYHSYHSITQITQSLRSLNHSITHITQSLNHSISQYRCNWFK